MGVSGIIRKIDDLGRISIPKELRRELRIKEGDAFELSAVNGVLIAKKYSELDAMADSAQQLCTAASKSCAAPIIITNRDSVIAMAGWTGCSLVGQIISPALVEIMDTRCVFQYDKGRDDKVYVLDHETKYYASLVTPILSDGVLLGVVVILGDIKDKEDGDVKYALSKTIATFLENL